MLNVSLMVKEEGASEASKEDLADYVKRIRRERGLSLKDVVRRSEGRISNGYVSQIENRYYINPTRDKLIALAKGLGVSEDEVFSVARGKSLSEDPDYKTWKYAALFDDAKRLTPEKMKRFETIMDIARREVTRMLEEQELEALHRSRRVPVPPKGENLLHEKEKNRA